MPRGIKKNLPKKCVVYQLKSFWRVRTDGCNVDWSSVDDNMNIVPIEFPTLELALRECDKKGFHFRVNFTKIWEKSATAEEL